MKNLSLIFVLMSFFAFNTFAETASAPATPEFTVQLIMKEMHAANKSLYQALVTTPDLIVAKKSAASLKIAIAKTFLIAAVIADSDKMTPEELEQATHGYYLALNSMQRMTLELELCLIQNDFPCAINKQKEMSRLQTESHRKFKP